MKKILFFSMACFCFSALIGDGIREIKYAPIEKEPYVWIEKVTCQGKDKAKAKAKGWDPDLVHISGNKDPKMFLNKKMTKEMYFYKEMSKDKKSPRTPLVLELDKANVCGMGEVVSKVKLGVFDKKDNVLGGYLTISI